MSDSQIQWAGGDGGIRTLDTPLKAYNGLANRRLQPLGHVSSRAEPPNRWGVRRLQAAAAGARHDP